VLAAAERLAADATRAREAALALPPGFEQASLVLRKEGPGEPLRVRRASLIRWPSRSLLPSGADPCSTPAVNGEACGRVGHAPSRMSRPDTCFVLKVLANARREYGHNPASLCMTSLSIDSPR